MKEREEITFAIDNLANPTKAIATFKAPNNISDNIYIYKPSLYIDGEIVYGANLDYSTTPVIFLESNDFKIEYNNWVDDESKLYYVDDLAKEKDTLDLDLKVMNTNATFTADIDFEFSSSDESIATINQDGEIVFSGKRGSVYFSLTALNGNMIGKSVSLKTSTISVAPGSLPFMVIPKGADTITTLENNAAEVRWTTNLVQKKIDEGINTNTDFTVEVYEAVYSGNQIEKGQNVHSASFVASKDNNISAYVIPENILENVSVIGKVSYIVEVCAEGLTTTGYIEVKSMPSIVTLTQPKNLYITDKKDTFYISYAIENFDTVNTGSEFDITITKNETLVYNTTDIADMTGGYNLVLDDVEQNSLKDIYTITVSAKNVLEPTWSYDSYMLYVFNDDALKMQIDGKEASDSITFDNNNNISSMSSEEILALNREIYLGGEISANKNAYQWSPLSDMIAWYSSDNGIASINTNVLGGYVDITKLNYPLYAPSRAFILSGLNDGKTTVSATHGLSKMTDYLDVTVNTLKNKLYIINVFPKVQSQVKYINGYGQVQIATTNSMGEVAIYEESGINSDIWVKASDNGDTYLGTIQKEKLRTKERDYSQKVLYPVNVIELVPVTKPVITLTNPDGTLFNGNVSITGGIYKNDEYCDGAKLYLNDGTIPQTRIINNGILEVELDSTQFINSSYPDALTPSDDIEFAFYINAAGYAPMLIYVDGNKSFEEIKQLAANSYRFKVLNQSQVTSPIVNSHTVIFPTGEEIRLSKNISRVGPNKNTGSIELVNEIICLGGDKANEYSAKLIDQTGIEPKGQSVERINYPFIPYPVLSLKQVLNSETLWMNDRQSRSVSVKVFENGNDITKVPLDFKIINLVNMDITEDSEITSMPKELKQDIMKSNDDYDRGDRIISKVLTAAGKVEGLDTAMVKMMLSPTADPTVFNTIMSVQIGYGDVGGIKDAEESGAYLTGPTKDAGELNVLGITNSDASGTFDMSDFSPSEFKKALKSGDMKKITSVTPSLEGGGYITGKIMYNFDKSKWEMITTSSNVNATAGVNLQILMNTQIGSVPVTAEFVSRGNIGFSYSGAHQYGTTIERLYGKEFVSDYLKTLRFDLYVYAFGGVGVDYSILAIKIGAFGEQDLSYEQRWLEQNYLDDRNKYGTELRAEGRVGIKFVAKALVTSYEKVLASAGYSTANHFGDWAYIDSYWQEYGKGSIQNDAIVGMRTGGINLDTISETVALESRDYLQAFDRKWLGETKEMFGYDNHRFIASLGIMTLDPENEVSAIETNSYPYSNPVFTDDGELLAYISDRNSSDVTDSRVYMSIRSGANYLEGDVISHNYMSYGDSNLDIDGTKNYAVATWVSQTVDIKKAASQELTKEDISLINNSSEIMASIYDGNSWSEPVKLTDNSNMDIAPIAMTNGTHTIVAYRSMYAPSTDDPFNFEGNDSIMYKVYDGSTWSEPITLYNGTLGNVKGLKGEMLSDGTASIVYSIEKSSEASTSTLDDLEVMYGVINPNGEIVTSVRATNNQNPDENPKITTHTFSDKVERFVIAWYSNDESSDLRLCAYNNEGLAYNGFVDSLSETLSNSNAEVTTNFQFAKSENNNDLTVVWAKPAQNTGEENKEISKDELLAIKILKENDNFYATSVCNIATMDDYTTIDHFDSRITAFGEVKAVILGTDYGTGVTQTYETEVGDVNVAVGESGLYTATGAFENSIRIDETIYDYTTIISGMDIPITVNVYNSGINKIDYVVLNFDGVDNTYELQSNPILSGSTRALTVPYTIPDEIENVEFAVTAHYENEDISTKNDTVYMYFPGVGISNFELIKEEESIREIAYTLYNDTRIDLRNDGYRVKVEFYDHVACEGTPLKTNIITSDEDIQKINEGTYTSIETFEVTDFINENEEIPAGGIKIYGKVVVEAEEGLGYITLPEINEVNNQKNVELISLIEKSNEKVTVQTVQRVIGGDTVIDVIVKNNSLVEDTSGNLIVGAVSASGEILEKKQGFDTSQPNNGLVVLGAEETTTKSFVFDSIVASQNVVTYSDTILDGNNADLGMLMARGYILDFNKNKMNYNIEDTKEINTKLTFGPANPNSTIKVNGIDHSDGIIDINVTSGMKTYVIEVTSVDTTSIKEYVITATTNKTNNTSGGSVSSSSSKSKNDNIIISESKKGNNTPIKVKGENVEITFNGETFGDFKNKNVQAKIEKIDKKDLKLSNELQDKIGNLPIFDINMYVNGSKTHFESDEPIVIEIPLSDEYTSHKVVAIYIDENGDTEIMEGVAIDGVMRFTTNHLSKYALMYVDKTFDDVTNHWGKKAVEALASRAIINGKSETAYDPEGNITRAEFTALLVRYFELQALNVNNYADVEVDAWYVNDVAIAKANGILPEIYDETFEPDKALTRQEMIYMLYKSLKLSEKTLADKGLTLDSFTDGEMILDYALEASHYLVSRDIIHGFNDMINPEHTSTRAEVAQMLYNLLIELGKSNI